MATGAWRKTRLIPRSWQFFALDVSQPCNPLLEDSIRCRARLARKINRVEKQSECRVQTKHANYPSEGVEVQALQRRRLRRNGPNRRPWRPRPTAARRVPSWGAVRLHRIECPASHCTVLLVLSPCGIFFYRVASFRIRVRASCLLHHI